jgi:hypothetical protein
MSDGAGPKKKIKIVGSARGTPTASRAGSPNPAQGSKFSINKLVRDGQDANDFDNRCLPNVFFCWPDRALGDSGEDPP